MFQFCNKGVEFGTDGWHPLTSSSAIKFRPALAGGEYMLPYKRTCLAQSVGVIDRLVPQGIILCGENQSGCDFAKSCALAWGRVRVEKPARLGQILAPAIGPALTHADAIGVAE
ncbi:hypothetical protein D3C80_1673480 [compost metagenome]